MLPFASNFIFAVTKISFANFSPTSISEIGLKLPSFIFMFVFLSKQLGLGTPGMVKSVLTCNTSVINPIIIAIGMATETNTAVIVIASGHVKGRIHIPRISPTKIINMMIIN